MKIAIWHTGHPIADTVAKTMVRSLPDAKVIYASKGNLEYVNQFDGHIGYGILRGCADVWRKCEELGKPYWVVDRGYFKPEHFTGYYRVSLRGTQQTGGWPEPDWERWAALGLPVEPMRASRGNGNLVCEPTDYVAEFFGVKNWFFNKYPFYHARAEFPPVRRRAKGSTIPLDDDFNSNNKVITFNSSVGWEALRRGISVESDPMHSIVGAWQAKHGTDKREELFATMAALDLTLDDMRGGRLWPLMERLLAADGR